MKTTLDEPQKPESVLVNLAVQVWVEAGTLTIVQGRIEKALFDAPEVSDYCVDLDFDKEFDR